MISCRIRTAVAAARLELVDVRHRAGQGHAVLLDVVGAVGVRDRVERSDQARDEQPDEQQRVERHRAGAVLRSAPASPSRRGGGVRCRRSRCRTHRRRPMSGFEGQRQRLPPRPANPVLSVQRPLATQKQEHGVDDRRDDVAHPTRAGMRSHRLDHEADQKQRQQHRQHDCDDQLDPCPRRCRRGGPGSDPAAEGQLGGSAGSPARPDGADASAPGRPDVFKGPSPSPCADSTAPGRDRRSVRRGPS